MSYQLKTKQGLDIEIDIDNVDNLVRIDLADICLRLETSNFNMTFESVTNGIDLHLISQVDEPDELSYLAIHFDNTENNKAILIEMLNEFAPDKKHCIVSGFEAERSKRRFAGNSHQ